MKSSFLVIIILFFAANNIHAQNFTSLGDGVKTFGKVNMSEKDTVNNITYIGGSFKSVNGLPVANVAMFDGTNWSALGSGIQGTIITMKMINGELYVAGYIQSAGGIPVNNIAKWNGTTWSAVGQGLPYVIREIEFFQNKIYITGFPPYTSVSYLASFDGTNWSQNLGSFDRNVNGMFVKGNELIIYGYFQLFNTDTVNGMISYNGTSFNYYPSSFTFGVPSAQLIDTTIYILNYDKDTISYYNGSQWLPYYIDSTNSVAIEQLFSYHNSLCVVLDSNAQLPYSSEYLILSKLDSNLVRRNMVKMRRDQGQFTIENIQTHNDEIDVSGWMDHLEDTLAISYFHYDGLQWTNPGKVSGENYYNSWANSSVYSIVKDSLTGDIYAAGSFLFAGITYSPNVARWDGTSWHAMSTGLSSRVTKLIFYHNELYAFGYFGYAGSNWVGRAAKWNGTTWQPFGTGFSGPVNDAIVFNNELYASGDFTSVNGVSANYIAKYNGTTWSPVGDNLLDASTIQMVAFNNTLIAASDYSYLFQAFDNSTCAYLDSNNQWQEMDITYSGGCNSMIVHNNDLFLSYYDFQGTLIFKWDGIQFNQICSGGNNWDQGIFLEYKNELYMTLYNNGFFKFDSTTSTLKGPLSTIQPLTILQDGATDYFGGFFPNFYVGTNQVDLNCIASFSPGLPMVSFTVNTDTICERENIFYEVNSTDPFATYSWHFTGVTPDTLNYPNPIIQYLTPGNFTTYLVVENLFGTDTIYLNGTITVLPCIASALEINQNAISVYPNPFTESLYFDSEKTIDHLTITDISGKIIYQRKSEQNSADLSFLEAGIYFLKCQSETSISTFRIIKQ